MPSNTKCHSCGNCTKNCPAGARTISGQTMTAREVMANLVRDRIFFEQSGGGVSFSGGEPTAQSEFLDELLTECRKEEINTAIDTCGSVETKTLIELAKKADLVLYDLKGYDDERHKFNTGVAATPILENLDTLARMHKCIWIRLPVVQGYTDDPNEMELLAKRYCSHNSMRRVEILPYHALGDSKLKRMGKCDVQSNLNAPSSTILDMLSEIWKRNGFDTHIGAKR